ncbi:MAG: hypothetical protein ACRDR6_10870 [Pseudonocardiaceae bacterium]
MTTRHLFIDETKDRDYLLVASTHSSGDLDALRKLVRGLVLKGQHRIHMKKESDSRKRAIAAASCSAGVKATIYDAGRGARGELEARAACLHAVVGDLDRRVGNLVVLEQDDSLIEWDRRQLYEITRALQVRGVRYEHRRANAEQLLAIPDAIAWCWAKGGDWRRRIHPTITAIRSV